MIEVIKKHTLTGHRNSVYTIAPSQYNNIFFSGAGDGFVVSWDLKDPENGQLIAKVPNSVYALHYIENRDLLAVGHNYDGVHLIRWQDKKEEASINFTEAAIFDIISWEQFLFVGTGNGELIILDPEKRVVVKKLKLSDKNLRTIAINNKHNQVALGFSDNTIKVLALDNLNVIKDFVAHELSVFSLKYTPDEEFLISASRDAHIKLWDVKAGYLELKDIVAHMYAINDIQFSPNSKYFATCSMDKSIKVWDSEQMKLLKVIDKGRHAGHGTSVNKLLWSPFNNWLTSCSDDRTISVWQIGLNRLED